MVGGYASSRLREQLKAVAFVVVYLVAFQFLVFGTAPAEAFRVAAGIAMVVFGLAFFLEGLLLGLMPLGQRVGIRLATRGGIVALVFFGVLVGVGSTLAEPAIAALRVAGAGVTAWEAPLLFFLLERIPGVLILSVGAGVGVAVAVGLLRFFFGFSLKPIILIVVPVLLAATVFLAQSPNLAMIIGLAWDTGAVTTGPVTVPLVLALGIGVSRAAGKSEGAAGGFGTVMLASMFPVLGVMALGVFVEPRVPEPVSEREFFSEEFRESALRLFADESDLRRYAILNAGEDGRNAIFGDEETYREAVRLLTLNGEFVADTQASPGAVLLEEVGSSLRAVIPLTALLGIVLVVLLRDRPRYLDEVILGIVFALVGMTFLAGGIRLGLAPLGDDVGRRLPQVLSEQDFAGDPVVIEQFDPDRVLTALDATGTAVPFFYLHDGDTVNIVPFDAERYDPVSRRYIHQPQTSRWYQLNLPFVGIVLVMIFAFGMGYGSTLAEPALNALGRTVEDLTVGTVRRHSVVRAVSIGVGIGLVVGVARIMYGIPIVWTIVPPYLVLLPLSILSEESFVGISWDSGGVTTGPVTVPLVLAMGLGIGGALGVVDGFGILAMASVYPILTVMIFGLFVRMKERRTIREAEQEDDGE